MRYKKKMIQIFIQNYPQSAVSCYYWLWKSQIRLLLQCFQFCWQEGYLPRLINVSAKKKITEVLVVNLAIQYAQTYEINSHKFLQDFVHIRDIRQFYSRAVFRETMRCSRCYYLKQNKRAVQRFPVVSLDLNPIMFFMAGSRILLLILEPVSLKIEMVARINVRVQTGLHF
jgi:hypothetical protein